MRDDIERQTEADKRYLAACKKFGIEPDPPHYYSDAHTHDMTDPQKQAWVQNQLHPLLRNPQEQEARDLSFLLRRLIEAIVGDGPPTHTSIRAAGARLLVLAFALNIEPFASERALATLAKKLEVSRALLSYYGLQLQNSLGVHVLGAKSQEARKNLSRARKKAVASGKADTRNAPWKRNFDS